METQNLNIVSEVQLHYQSKIKPSERPKITTATDVYNIMQNIPELMQNLEFKELFYAIYLNQGNKVLSVLKISEGGTSNTVVDVKNILQGAILQNATGVILCHNHPSGSPNPSTADINLTKKIGKACDLFDIRLLEHLIITSEDYYSFTSERII